MIPPHYVLVTAATAETTPPVSPTKTRRESGEGEKREDMGGDPRHSCGEEDIRQKTDRDTASLEGTRIQTRSTSTIKGGTIYCKWSNNLSN